MVATTLHRANRLLQCDPDGSPDAGKGPGAGFRFFQVSTWPDVRETYGLLHACYLRKGLIDPDPTGLRYTHYNLLPSSATFGARGRGRVVATFSLIPDTPGFGLPMDALYGRELDPLRREGRKPGEISGLAVDPGYRAVSLLLILNLVRMLHAYSSRLDLTDLVVACHPRHARMYERMFLFEPFGPVRTYRAVNDAPAVALRLDLVGVQERYRAAFGDGDGLYRFFFLDRVLDYPDTALREGAFSQDVIRRLLSLRPALADVLESREPGLVERLTGWRSRAARRFFEHVRLTAGSVPAAPAFLPA